MLLNNFVATTASFFNSFSETVEKKISGVSSKITELETLLAVLEAKLNSIPDLDSSDIPQSATSTSTVPENSSTSEPSPPQQVPLEPVPSETAPAVVADAVQGDSNMCPVSEHPDYVAFFKLLKVGVPPFVVQAKVNAAGLDGSMIDTPDRLVSK